MWQFKNKNRPQSISIKQQKEQAEITWWHLQSLQIDQVVEDQLRQLCQFVLVQLQCLQQSQVTHAALLNNRNLVAVQNSARRKPNTKLGN